MDYWLLLLLQIVPIVVLINLYLNQKFSFWSKQGLKGPKPFLFFGNLWDQLKKGSILTETEWFQKYGKVYGTYSGFQPVLTIADPELIKQVMVKDFNLFVNRRKTASTDNVASKNLFELEGDDWKRVRAITSPSFTSGKLRGMIALMNHCIDKLADYFENISTEGDGVIDTKNVVSGFTIDVIASTSFATETNANGDRSKENPFIQHGAGLFKINPVRLIFNIFSPVLIRKLINKIFPPKHFHFFRDLSRQVVKQRRETNFKRNDFVQLLMDAYVSENELQNSNYEQLTANADKEEEADDQTPLSNSKITKSLNDDEIIAQCIIFFIAGFETTASTISHCVFELAKNQKNQERLNEELRTALNGLDVTSELYHDTVMSKIPFLYAVIKETLRMYPPLTRLERRVGVEGYKLAGITLEKEQLVTIAAYAVQNNPEYYPEPEQFKPDRFMPENKHLLTPYTYMPFGQGPRNCIGMRFAYQEIKLCLAKIIPRYRFSPTSETPEKLIFTTAGLLSVKPFPLKVSKRE